SRAARKGQPVSRPIWMCSAAGAALIYSHPFVAFWVVLGMALLALADIMTAAQKKPLLIAALSVAALTLAVTAPYWVNLLLLYDVVDARRQLNAPNRFYSLGKLLTTGGPSVNPYLYFAAFAGFAVAWRQRHALALGGIGLLLVFM